MPRGPRRLPKSWRLRKSLVAGPLRYESMKKMAGGGVRAKATCPRPPPRLWPRRPRRARSGAQDTDRVVLLARAGRARRALWAVQTRHRAVLTIRPKTYRTHATRKP